jgi:alanyl-tRNA synthetase
MGLERLAAVLQGVHSNYDIDLFRDLMAAAAKLTGAADLTSPSLRVIADHIRACAFLIVDGVIPSNEGRGYVLRRIARRAIRHGYQLGQTKPFFAKLVPDLARLMGDAYPELPLKQDHVIRVLQTEEERFAATLEHGMKVLDAALAQATAGGSKILPGLTAFTLYDTYGFPLDLTADVCRERGITVDQAGFDEAMEKQRGRGRDASTFKMPTAWNTAVRKRFSTVTTRWWRKHASSRCIATGAPSTRFRPDRAASSSSTARLSMRSRAARSAIAASCRRAGPVLRCSRCTIPRRSSPTSSATTAS